VWRLSLIAHGKIVYALIEWKNAGNTGMERFIFYLQYAFRNLWRSRRWSSFAVLSVAAGVAAVVALRSLGLAIGDSLTSNIRASNHGDIRLERSVGPSFGQGDEGDIFTDIQLQLVIDWAEANDAQITAYTTTALQVSSLDEGSLLNFVSAVLIDPKTYPVTQDILALEPKGVPLGQLFQGGREIVISENLALSAGITVGDEVTVTGTPETFTVRGIVPTEAEAGLRDILAAFFGFVYVDHEMAAEWLSAEPRPNGIGVLLPEGTTHDDIEDAGKTLNRFVDDGSGFVRLITVPKLLKQNEFIADIIGRFIVVMGLGAMLIGGVGIINTMLVMTRRRTVEIAALKTFGLKGRQIAIMFMTEALLLGLVGSVVGAVAGAFLSRLTMAYGEAFVLQSLTWKLYPEAILFGVVLGFVVTGVFGVMPVLSAVKVRPNVILRPNETHVPATGLLHSAGALLFVVVSLGLVAGQIIGPLPEPAEGFLSLPVPAHYIIGIIGVSIALLILGLLVLLLWVVVWLVGKFPAFGWVDLRLALRNLSTHRIRTATTLLAISTGMFAISGIAFYGASVQEILQLTLTQTLGGNVMILSPASFLEGTGLDVAENTQRMLDETLDELDGVVYRTQLLSYDGRMNQVDDLSLRDLEVGINQAALIEELHAASRSGDFDRAAEISEQLWKLTTPVTISMWDSDNPDLRPGEIVAGRGLTPEDRGEPVAILLNDARMQNWDVVIGSMITVEVDEQEFTFEVVGLVDTHEIGPPGMLSDLAIPAETLGEITPRFRLNTIMVEDEAMGDVMRAITAMPFFFALDVALIDNIIGRFIDQFASLPLLVGILSLGAAAIIMANTVALATLERRKQIGILKAIGLKSRRVLSIMLLENILVSLLGGVLGIGLSVVGILSLSLFGWDELTLIPNEARPIAVALVVIAVIIGSAATFLSANTAVRERVLNVLRYE
jgi:putative ABC transport system permease protein